MTKPSKYGRTRDRVVPPHVSIGALRKATRRTLESVVNRMNELDPHRDRPWTTGALSAVELGHRGAGAEMLVLLAEVYGIAPEDLDTAYIPRARTAVAS